MNMDSLQELAGKKLANHIEFLIAPHLRKYIMVPFNKNQQYYKACEKWIYDQNRHATRILPGHIPNICHCCHKILVFVLNLQKHILIQRHTCTRCGMYVCEDCYYTKNDYNIVCKKCINAV